VSAGSRDNGLCIARQNRDTVPGFLADPGRGITGACERFVREVALRGLQFLQADDVGRGLAQPGEQVRQAFVDVVDVEGRDFHGVLL
jgi:hypothetical protein